MIDTLNHPPASRRLFTTKEAARLLRVSHRTLEDWRITGQGPRFQKLGRLVRYPAAEIDRFVDGPCFTNTGESGARGNCG